MRIRQIRFSLVTICLLLETVGQARAKPPIPPVRLRGSASAPPLARSGPAIPPFRLQDRATAVARTAGPEIPPFRLREGATAVVQAGRGGPEIPPFRARAPEEAGPAATTAVAGGGPEVPPFRMRDGQPASAVVSAPVEKPVEKPAEVAVAPPKAGGLEFDLFNEGGAAHKQAPKLDLQIERKVRLRRSLLQWHQAIGFVTLAALAATVVIGHLNYVDNFTSGDFTGRYDKPHLGLSIATTGLFATTGMLALVAPNPYPKKVRFDSATVHKAAMALATAGMITQLILGPIIYYREGKLDQPNWALAHVITGYATFGFMAIGTVAYVF